MGVAVGGRKSYKTPWSAPPPLQPRPLLAVEYNVYTKLNFDMNSTR